MSYHMILCVDHVCTSFVYFTTADIWCMTYVSNEILTKAEPYWHR